MKEDVKTGYNLGKLPPQAIDLEEAVLGALMLEKDAINVVIDTLKPESFYKDAHQEIYTAIITLFNKSEPIDILTVANQLRKNAKLDISGGAYYISELTSKVSSAANIEYHTRIIIEKATKRQMILMASEILKSAYDDTIDTFELMDMAESSLVQVHQHTSKRQCVHVSKISDYYFEEVKEKAALDKEITGIPSGIINVDRKTYGWQNGDLIIIAARPSMGKTAFVLTCARNAAVDFKKPVAIFSLEMSETQVLNRLWAIQSGIDSEKIKHGRIRGGEWVQLGIAKDAIDSSPIFIDDTPALSIMELRAKCRRLKAQQNIELIIVDYLQLMAGENKKGNREAEISSISRGLKAVAKELNVPLIALSQLSRSVETRGGEKRPQLSDLRESGSIEQDADIVAFLYRPEYYGIEQDESGQSLIGIGQIDFAKNRNGSLGRRNMKFIKELTKFSDIDAFQSPQSQIDFNNNTPY